MSTTWRGMQPSMFLYDEMQYDTSGYRIPEPPVPSMAEINDMITRFQAQNRRAFGPFEEPTPEQVAEAMEKRFAEHDAEQQLLAKIKQDILGTFGLQERHVAVVPRTYQQRKQRRKKTTA